MLNTENHIILKIKTIFLSKEFRIFFLVSVVLNEVIFHLDPFTFSVRTNADIIYDFSGSWRNHISRFLGGEQLYKDFYYPYPPLGFYMISAIFYLTGANIFYQTIATSIIAILIHIGIFLLVEKKVGDEKIKSAVLITSLFFLNGSQHEIFLGGNPFPLILGFLFFVFALVYSDRPITSVVFVLLAASCKHEYWIGAFLLTIYYTYRNYKVILPIFAFIALVNLCLGYTSFDLISGMGRSSWARWNFHWEGFLPQVLFIISLILFRKSIIIFLIYTFLVILSLHLFDQNMVLSNPIFLVPLVYILLNKSFDLKYLFIFSVILSLQARRGFEWNEFTFDSLLPIFLTFRSLDFSIIIKNKYVHCIILLLLSLSTYRYAISNIPHFSALIYNNEKYKINSTYIGNISSHRYNASIAEFREHFEGKSVFTFPFCAGLNILTGSKNSSPVSYFYNRDFIKTFDYYNQDIGKPDFIILDEKYLTWHDYPKLQNPFLKWVLFREKIDLIGKYPEIIDLIDEEYDFIRNIDNYMIYARSNK